MSREEMLVSEVSAICRYLISVPGSGHGPAVYGILHALAAGGYLRTKTEEDGKLMIECPNQRFQKLWTRRLKTAERDDCLTGSGP